MLIKNSLSLILLLVPLFHTLAQNERQLWVDALVRIADPVLRYAAHDSLKIMMPIHNESTAKFQYLEALGRTICGVAPWLELDDDATEESSKREALRTYAIQSIRNAVNPEANDYAFPEGNQTLVDAAYLAQGLLRAPNNLWDKLDEQTKQRLIAEMKRTRHIQPGQNNWLLFSSMVEAFLLEYTGEYDESKLRGGVMKFIDGFYHGDGIYGDGRNFAMDYYNSFVIHPMLTDIIMIGAKHELRDFKKFMTVQIPRLQRYACIQKRMVSPEGAYPVIGRTLICRIGAFHALAEAVLVGNVAGEFIHRTSEMCYDSLVEKTIRRKF